MENFSKKNLLDVQLKSKCKNPLLSFAFTYEKCFLFMITNILILLAFEKCDFFFFLYQHSTFLFHFHTFL